MSETAKIKSGDMVMRKPFGIPLFLEHIYYDEGTALCTWWDEKGKQFREVIELTSVMKCTLQEIDTSGP